MSSLNLKNIDPRAVARVADYVGRSASSVGASLGAASMSSGTPWLMPGVGAPVNAPVGMPAPGGGGGYNRYVSASRCIMQMLYLQSVKKGDDINLYINSPGGVVDDTLAIYDIMKFLTCDIATYCIGRAESGGAIVFAAGKKGKRYILPNAKVMIHQPFGGVYGQAADIEIQAEEILKTKQTLVNVLAKCTGQTPERIQEDSERDRFFNAKAAVEYGLCDEVIGEDSSEATALAASDGSKTKE
jgi:ATP-dependent Clp protease, protease subunit